MAHTVKKNNRMRKAGAYVSSVISIALVLVLVGVAATISVNAGNVADYFKENLQVSVLLNQEATEKTAEECRAQIAGYPFVKSTRVVSKEEGTEELKKMLGEDFLDVFESSPVPISIDVTMNAEYVQTDSLDKVVSLLESIRLVDEVSCQKSLVEALNANLTKITLVLMVFISLMLFVSFVLIGNVVRISVFSNRFSIHTMKLVGATRSFIRAPYLRASIVQGLIAAALALLILGVGMAVLRNGFPQLFEIFGAGAVVKSSLIVIVSGVAICLLSTYFTVNKLVSMSKDDLYS